jgi:hypothetical protein
MAVVMAAIAAWGIERWAPGAITWADDPAATARTAPKVDFDVAAHAVVNDVPVLRAALAKACEGEQGSTLLAAEPIDHFDWRTESHPTIPELPRCAGIDIVRWEKIEAAYAGPGALSPDAPGRTVGWARLERDFPRARSWFRVSLPTYTDDGRRARVLLRIGGPCGHCSFAFEIDLEEHGGRWILVEQRTTSSS